MMHFKSRGSDIGEAQSIATIGVLNKIYAR